MRLSKRYTPTRARLDRGSLGFSSRRLTLPSAISATPKSEGFGTGVRGVVAAGAWGWYFRVQPATPDFIRLSRRYMMKSLSPRKSLAVLTAWARPRGAGWGM